MENANISKADARDHGLCMDEQPQLSRRLPSKLDHLRQHSIEISFLSSGVIIKVGCKNIAFSTIEEAMDELNKYVAKPEISIQKWNSKFDY